MGFYVDLPLGGTDLGGGVLDLPLGGTDLGGGVLDLPQGGWGMSLLTDPLSDAHISGVPC